MFPHSPGVIAGQAFWAAAIAAALFRGSRAERVAAIALFAQLMLTFCNWGGTLNGKRWASFSGDIIVSVVLVALATRTRCVWARRATPFQLLSTAAFSTKVIDPAVKGYAYLLVDQLFGFIVIGLMLWGVFVEAPAHRRESAR